MDHFLAASLEYKRKHNIKDIPYSPINLTKTYLEDKPENHPPLVDIGKLYMDPRAFGRRIIICKECGNIRDDNAKV